MKVAIIYHYFEKDIVYRDNLVYFLNTGLSIHNDYYFYVSGKSTVRFPNHKNIFLKEIDNKNFDFNSLLEFKQDNKSRYDAYIILNCTVRGPFIANYHMQSWWDIFLSQLTDDVGIVGSSINILDEDSDYSRLFQNKFHMEPPFPHVQTYAYALSRISYDLLSQNKFYECFESLSKEEVILRYEILQSQIILQNGLSISSILPSQRKISKIGSKITGVFSLLNEYKKGSYITRKNFFGRTLKPIETLFTKTSVQALGRPVDTLELASYTITGLLPLFSNAQLDKDGLDLFEKSKHHTFQEHPKRYLIEELPFLLQEIRKERPDLAESLKKLL